jgi:hypothetical protein
MGDEDLVQKVTNGGQYHVTMRIRTMDTPVAMAAT